MKNGLGRNVNSPTRPSDTLREAHCKVPEIHEGDCVSYSVHVVRIWRGKCGAKMKNGLGRDVNETVFCLFGNVSHRKQGYNSDIERYL